ncbi:MAG: sugar phosphate isomerase/epimerase, partial [Clostridia bacterium]|nr:sugar phosphate isomerase/epimerase [Clostridia bacterium]
MGLSSCQLSSWNRQMWTDENAENIIENCKRYNIKNSTFWCGWCGPAVWNFYEGPETLGLVPLTYRFERMKDLMLGSDFAKKIGVADVATHVGFIPENPNDALYPGLVSSLKVIAGHCKSNGQYFNFETGQETPVTLLRIIEDIGLDNLGINLDPANFILYGKANPCDAMDIIGKYVRGIHGKDGLYPTSGRELGHEVKIGDGKVNFPKLIKLLNEYNYKGDITIEREISGDQQIKDILESSAYLKELLSQYQW